MVGGGDNGGNKIVATLRGDFKVISTPDGASITQLANLMNYKIRTECDVYNKPPNSLSTTVVDLGKQLLQFARDSDLKGVKNALSRGAPFTSDWLGMSALHFAAMNNQYEICQVLLNGGINKDSKTKVDRTPLHLACYYGNESIVELLLSKKCLTNPKDMLKMTPLHWAVEKRFKTIVRLLLKHNADVTLASKFGRTPVGLAVLTEQADILEELEVAKQAQLNRKFNEENEKETSDAVNSIMGIPISVAEEVVRKIDNDDDLTNQSDYATTNIADLENIKETGILGDSTINLLKSHGISMMPDDDTSKDLFNTALQNGRQLILSEGGKLLLNETKKIQDNQNPNNNSINPNSNSNNLNNNNSNNNNKCNISNDINNSKTIVPVRVQNENLKNTITQIPPQQQLNKGKPNILSRVKDNTSINKNKNIRIMSFNDFRKFCGNTNVKTLQQIPTSLASNRLVKIEPVHPKQQQQQQHIQLQRNIGNNATNPSANSSTFVEDNIIDDSVSVSKIGTLESVEVEMENSKSPPPLKIIQPLAVRQQPIRVGIPPRQIEQIGSVQIRQIAKPAIKQYGNINRASNGGDTKPFTSGNSPLNSSANKIRPSTVVPLLTLPEICRQLLELRKQNEELKRNFDLEKKEKEEISQRLERLEELLLVERTDEDFIVS
ncbi:probable serine/threonine-protein kinase DDB_G0286465 [Glossina fuscipes]|uniref:Probable serine/threonine-protein kinase DDB_G0286465 n=1 Tax=Glossina fuscipes TaxID=7396 RepID=A0A9C6E2N3_9MUSC|nr:probable serine/threonine-protein kinase DDB_G0286465 [Glossina fuscipes]XP_037901442.1 probable serine/threonine-protein kinase DDB_G0286465 [Glossina fuscipes]